MQPDDPIGIGIGEGPKEHAVDDAEDGCGGANAEAERQNRHHRVRLGAEEEPHPIAQVAEKVLEERGPILVARLLLEVFDSAELDERLAARFVRRHSGVTVLLGLLVDVESGSLSSSPRSFCPPCLSRRHNSRMCPSVVLYEASRIRLMARDSRRQCASSSAKYRRPSLVSA